MIIDKEEMERNIEIISIVLSSAIMLHFAYRTYQLIIGNEKLIQVIRQHYSEKGQKIINVARLSLTEKLKYGAPLTIFRFYNYYFGLLTEKIEYVRKIEVEGQNDSFTLKYIELQIRKKEVISIKEFDEYEL